MTELYNDDKLRGLFSRSYNSVNVEAQDEADLKDYIQKVFGTDGRNPNPALLHQFNQLVVEKADEIFKQKATDLLSLLATYKRKNLDEQVMIDVPQNSKVKMVWSALGSGVDMQRIGNQKRIPASRAVLSTGFYYEPRTFSQGNVESFRELINLVADAKVEMYVKKVTELMQAAITASKIPDANVETGANLTLADYNSVAGTLARYGGRPTFVADLKLIDHFAMQQVTDPVYKELLTDKIREDLVENLNPTRIGRTIAVNLVNPFIDETNTAVELPVNEGYMFAGGVNAKPFHIIEYGTMRQLGGQNIEDERVQLKLVQEVSIDLIFGQAIGFIKDTSVTL